MDLLSRSLLILSLAGPVAALADPSAALSADGPAAPLRPSPNVTLPQCFIESEQGFFVLGDGIAASLEAGRLRWILTDTTSAEPCRSIVTIEPMEARAGVVPVGEGLLPGVVSRFHGPPSEWRTGQRTFRAVRYAQLWSGIDLVLEAEGQTLKGTYVVDPGADPRAVRLRHRGADAVTIDAQGRLVVHTAAGDLVDAAPVAWQEIDDAHVDVPVAFRLEPVADGSVDVVFDVGDYDPAAPLLLDPAVIVQAGFLGGAEDDYPGGIEVGDDGCVYVAGGTTSSEASFPTLVGPDLTFAGPVLSTGGDVYVAKLDPTGTTLLYVGFIGGSQREGVWDTALDSLGRLYVGGLTESSPAQGFPVLIGPDVTHNGNCDGFAARVSADGTALEYCGYMGGNGEDFVANIDVDDSFRAYVVGRFDSIAATLPIHQGPVLTQPGGAYDGFIARIRSDGDWHDYCGYLGGDDIEDIQEVVADGAGGAWFAGYTWSQDFPTVGALGPVGNGSIDFIIGHVNADGSAITAAGYVGGDSTDVATDIEMDDSGAVYVGGVSFGATTFPATVGPNLTPSGATDGVILKVTPDGQSLEWAGFTNTGDRAEVAIDDGGAAWFLSNVSNGGGIDPAIARVALSGAEVEIQEVLDLPDDTTVRYFAPVPSALTPGSTDFWLAGWTTATEATFPVGTGPDVTHNGKHDTVLLQVSVADENAWTDLGFSKAGTHGDPALAGTGTLGSLSPLTLSLSDALESTTAWLVYGVSAFNAPFFGGIMVPDPAPPGSTTPLFTTPAGTFDIAGTWPTGVPAGFSIYLQYWIEDPGATFGFAASNALQGTTP